MNGGDVNPTIITQSNSQVSESIFNRCNLAEDAMNTAINNYRSCRNNQKININEFSQNFENQVKKNLNIRRTLTPQEQVELNRQNIEKKNMEKLAAEKKKKDEELKQTQLRKEGIKSLIQNYITNKIVKQNDDGTYSLLSKKNIPDEFKNQEINDTKTRFGTDKFVNIYDASTQNQVAQPEVLQQNTEIPLETTQPTEVTQPEVQQTDAAQIQEVAQQTQVGGIKKDDQKENDMNDDRKNNFDGFLKLYSIKKDCIPIPGNKNDCNMMYILNNDIVGLGKAGEKKNMFQIDKFYNSISEDERIKILIKSLKDKNKISGDIIQKNTKLTINGDLTIQNKAIDGLGNPHDKISFIAFKKYYNILYPKNKYYQYFPESNEYYKYLKYKNKYLELKNKIIT